MIFSARFVVNACVNYPHRRAPAPCKLHCTEKKKALHKIPHVQYVPHAYSALKNWELAGGALVWHASSEQNEAAALGAVLQHT